MFKFLQYFRKKAIDKELENIEPIVQQAREAVGNIKSEALSEIRSMRAPPDVIRDILEGVLRLMGIMDTSWNSMKVFLAKRGVKEDIRYVNIYEYTMIIISNKLFLKEKIKKKIQIYKISKYMNK